MPQNKLTCLYKKGFLYIITRFYELGDMGSDLADCSLIHHVPGVILQSAHCGLHALMLFRAECKCLLLKTQS